MRALVNLTQNRHSNEHHCFEGHLMCILSCSCIFSTNVSLSLYHSLTENEINKLECSLAKKKCRKTIVCIELKKEEVDFRVVFVYLLWKRSSIEKPWKNTMKMVIRLSSRRSLFVGFVWQQTTHWPIFIRWKVMRIHKRRCPCKSWLACR